MSSMVIQVEPSDSGNVFEPLDPEEHGWLTVGPSRELDARSAEVVGAIEDGVRQAWDRGPLLGFAVQGCAARLVRASFQASSLPARSIVERCALRATSQALKAADMRLLEPVMLLQVSVPEDAVGKVLSDLTGQRRAHIRGIETDRSAPTGSRCVCVHVCVCARSRCHRASCVRVRSIVEAEVPIEALQGYSTVLRSITSGRASFVMEFLHYGPLSSDAQQRVLLERRGYA